VAYTKLMFLLLQFVQERKESYLGFLIDSWPQLLTLCSPSKQLLVIFAPNNYWLSGQLSVNELLSLRSTLSVVDVTNYHLYGSPITHSRSPFIHNTGFLHYGLNSKYSLFDTTDIEKVAENLRKLDSGGGSVTIPHKQSILKYLDEVSPSAAKIGAVNTVYKENGKLLGTNTDWFAFHNLVLDKLCNSGKRNPQQLHALVIGAGGTARAACYALSELGIPFFIFNRSQEAANDLASHFGGGVCQRLVQNRYHWSFSLEEIKKVDVVIGTVPPTAQFQLPEHLLTKDMLIVELIYFPRITQL
jgi:pentafunctional AROM polypeptide